MREAVFSPTSTRILTAGEDSTARLWDLEGKLLQTFAHSHPSVMAVAFHPKGKWLASAAEEELRIWESTTGKKQTEIKTEEAITDLAFSPDGKWLAVAIRRNQILLYETTQFSLAKTLPLRANWAYHLAFHPEGRRLFAGFETGVAYFEMPEGKPISVFEDLQYEPDAVQPRKIQYATFSSDGRQLLTWGHNWNTDKYPRLRLWDSQTAQHLQGFEGLFGGIMAAFSPDDRYIVMGCAHWEDKSQTPRNGMLHLLDKANGQSLASWPAHNNGLNGLAFSPNGEYLLTYGSKDREVVLWNAAQLLSTRSSGQLRAEPDSPKPPVSTESISYDLDDLEIVDPQARYFALIISVANYQDAAIKDLEAPSQDAEKLKSTLLGYYRFEESLTKRLLDPSRTQIINALDELSQQVTENDNLLIFYAGHGYWDAALEQGYWLPADAQKDRRANWLANSELGNYIRGIKSKHTLLITDACFSGSIFEATRNAFDNAPKHIQNLYARASRKAMTSGAKEEVPDRSIFLEYLIKGLQDNMEPYLTASELFNYIQTPVLSNTSNAPQFGVIRNARHEGGDFVFVKK
ncbi:MAG: hypothetical protein HC913_20165 [Microscillaceae bacterium]|nr:hypothetical protein [Microscillaceae bacterium]